jgi:CRP/FNR family transcriptional regulator
MTKTPKELELIRNRIGFLFDAELLEEIISVGKLTSFPSESSIMHPGDAVMYIPFVLDGAIKIMRENDEGEELLLYYIESGDTCAMTLQCCVRNTKSQIKAIAIEDATLLMVPMEYMEKWLDKYPSWRSYILESYHSRMIELMETIDSITFKRLDERLSQYLTDQAKLHGSLEINYTHQQIAEDLHSSRVVISRLLKQMEAKSLIQLHRNRIVLKSI